MIELLMKVFETLKDAQNEVLIKPHSGVTITEIQSLPREFPQDSGFPIINQNCHIMAKSLKEKT